MNKAYPVYDQAYPAHVATIQSYLQTIGNLQTIGRNGQHRYNNQDHSMLTGVYAARNITGERYDVWSVNVEKDYHEEAKSGGDRMVPSLAELEPTVTARTFDDMIAAAFARLDPMAMGIAVGTVCGLGILFATIVLMLKGGDSVGKTLGLLSNYLLGYNISWIGALIGAVEVVIGGFALGYGGAWLRNWCIDGYAYLVKRSANAKQQRDVLGQI
jgi:hypothetical protein